MHLDLTTEALYVSNKKKDSSSVSRVLRHPGLLWLFFQRQQPFYRIQEGCCVAELSCTTWWHSALHVLVADQPLAPQLSLESESGWLCWVGDATPASPMTGWTQAAFTSVAQQEDLGTYVGTCVKTLVFNKVCVYTSAFPLVRAIRSLSSTLNLYLCRVYKDFIVLKHLSNLPETGHLCKIALGIQVRGMEKQICQIWPAFREYWLKDLLFTCLTCSSIYIKDLHYMNVRQKNVENEFQTCSSHECACISCGSKKEETKD